ncbi:MAG: hypothetical protein ACD_75C00686G0002 [uncultured bacterium]|nr:MAG: hypothetical protein ACD_75C00686G0002 [uncultured bacterium]
MPVGLYVAQKSGVERRINRGSHVFGRDELDADAAGHAEHSFGSVEKILGRLEKGMLALPLDTAAFDIHIEPLLCRPHPQQGGQDFRLLVPTLLAHGNTGITAEDGQLFMVFDHPPYFFKRFLLSYYHIVSTPSPVKTVVPPPAPWAACFSFSVDFLFFRRANQMGDGPIALIFLVNSVHISAHRGPCAADRLKNSRRAGSIPIMCSMPLIFLTLFAALRFPSRK